MTWWHVYSKARSQKVAIEGIYAGSTAFLVGGSPQLLQLDLRLMKLPGVWSMAINNAAVIFEPQAFIGVDVAACFNHNIFSNCRIMKMLSYRNHDNLIDGKRVCRYPNTFFFDSKNHEEMMMSEFCSLQGPLPIWRQTFFTALAALYQLGFKRVNLIGCTFDNSDGAYAHGKEISDQNLKKNQIGHDEIIDKLVKLIPMIEDEGMEIRTCHDNTNLDGVIPYLSFSKAISEVVIASTSIKFNDFKHVTERSNG